MRVVWQLAHTQKWGQLEVGADYESLAVAFGAIACGRQSGKWNPFFSAGCGLLLCGRPPSRSDPRHNLNTEPPPS